MQWGALTAQRPTLNPLLQATFNQLQPIQLHEVKAAALYDRIDTKYLLTEMQVLEIFNHLLDRYKVLEVEGYRENHYRTLYFDTPALNMYIDHHNGVRDRFKVRIRSYMDSGISFLEVKRKTSRGRTVKARIPIEAALPLDARALAFLSTHCPYDPAELIPCIYNDFVRVTLVGIEHIERLTLDFALTLGNEHELIELPGLVVFEVKQKKFTAQAGIFRQLHALHLRPASFSKYTFATAQFTRNIKRNRFKERHLHVARVLAACEALNVPT